MVTGVTLMQSGACNGGEPSETPTKGGNVCGWNFRGHRGRGGEVNMPRYLVERTFVDGLQVPVTEEGAATCLAVVHNNGELGVTWVHSYVTTDKSRTFCIYDGPDAAAIRRAA